MRVEIPGGLTLELGATETAPTIGILDYSRRVTDDFGVTTVVQRGFSRIMSVRLAVPFDGVDVLQRRLAAVRATSATWVADDRFQWLMTEGFYKDFSIDLNGAPLSYCTLTVEGLAATEVAADAGGDPAPDGQTSTLQLLQPVAVAGSVLSASNVPEADAPGWAAGTAYALGAHVIKAATHRVYESAIAGNIGHDPEGSALWIDIGPTNRWAMFDQALGTATAASGSIVVTLAAGTVDAVALLDVVGATVRVQAPSYDRTVAITGATIPFLDLPLTTGSVTVTIAGSGEVSVGTLLIGRRVALGITEASPTAGITDYSRKAVDDFGEVTIVQRAWAKRMTAKALIRTDALDLVANRVAAVRALPSLWIGQAGLDSLTVYGFFKDFSIEVGENVSKLSLSIEGLSTAAKVAPLLTEVAWPDILDPDGTKPEDNATKGAPAGSLVGDTPAEDVIAAMLTTNAAIAAEIMRGGLFRTYTDEKLVLPDGSTVREVVESLGISVPGLVAFVEDLRSVDDDGNLKALTILNSAGHITGTYLANDGTRGTAYTVADEWGIIDPADADDPDAVPTKPLYYVDGELYADHLTVQRLKVNTAILPVRAAATSPIAGTETSTSATPTPATVLTAVIVMPEPGWIEVTGFGQQSYTGSAAAYPYLAGMKVNGAPIAEAVSSNTAIQGSFSLGGSFYAATAGTFTVTFTWNAITNITLEQRAMFVKGFRFTE